VLRREDGLLNEIFHLIHMEKRTYKGAHKDLEGLLAFNQGIVRFGALEEVFMSYRPHGAWRTMEVLEELA
jgi:hypothetical protein